MKIISWNVNGLRAAIGKNFADEVRAFDADIFCVQETKAQDDQVAKALEPVNGYKIFSASAEKKGYSGVALLSKEEPIHVREGIGKKVHDTEGRVLTAEYKAFHLVNVYVPNSGSGLKRLDYRSKWDKAFTSYIRKLKKEKPVIMTGDFNVAHQAIDLARPQSNYNKTPGYTQVEIDGMTKILKTGLVDSFRMLYPDKIQYTFWSMRLGARARNIGWRIDYFLVDKALSNAIQDITIHDQVMGSDHCPIELRLNM